jgi:glycogen operon protein
MATLLLSQGVPMILGGDELLRTQRGNNNAWCQDNELGWVDWSLRDCHADFLRFVRMLIAIRRSHPILRRRTFFSAEREGHPPEILWHGVEPSRPDFGPQSHALAFALDGRRGDRPGVVDRDLYVAFNTGSETLAFRIPASPTGRPWRRAVDTALPSPDDIVEEDRGPLVPVGTAYPVRAHSLIVLISEAGGL